MKMNWGMKLITGMALFMLFIATLVTVMISRSGRDTLIEEDYYERGQSYDNDYNAKQNAVYDETVPDIMVNKNGVRITFPLAVNYELAFRRFSDRRMDRSYRGNVSKDQPVSISADTLQPGPWQLLVRYTNGAREYLYEKELIIP